MNSLLKKLGPILIFTAVSAAFYTVLNLIFGCPGPQKGPWTTDQIRSIKNLEHVIYWLCVIGIPSLFLLISHFLNFSLADNKESTKQEHPPQSNTSLYIQRLIFFILIPIYIFFITPRTDFHSPLDMMEEGHKLSVAEKTTSGAKAYKDIYFIYGPGIEIVQPKIAFALFGKSLASLRKLDWNLEPIGMILLYFLLLILLKNKWLILMLLMIIPTNSFIHPRMIFSLLALILFTLGLSVKKSSQQKILLMGSGLICVLGYFYSMESGIFPFIGIAISLLIYHSIHKNFNKGHLKHFILGSMILSVPLFIWFILTGRFGSLIFNIFGMRDLMLTAQAKPAPILCEPIIEFIKNPFLIFKGSSVWLNWWAPVGFYIGLLSYLIYEIKSGSFNNDQLIRLTLVVTAILFFTISLGRSDYNHWIKATALYWILLIVIADKCILHIRSFLNIGDQLRSLSAGLLTLLIMGIFFRFSSLPYNIHPYVTFSKFPITSKAQLPPELNRIGGIDLSETEINITKNIIERIQKYSNKRDYVYIFSDEALYYFLADVVNPTRYAHNIIVYGDRAVREVISSLTTKKPKLILVEKPKLGLIYESDHQKIRSFIEENYSQVDQFSDYSFMVLK